MSKSTPRVIKEEPLDSKDARWIKLERIHYTLPSTARTLTYERASRTTRPSHTPIDSIGIVAIIPHPPPRGPHILLQKQFRPALGLTCIEVPAGLIDEADAGPLEAAKRELKEETGYEGVVVDHGTSLDRESNDDNDNDDDFATTPVLYSDPGFTNTNTVMVHMEIDPSTPANAPQLEEGSESTIESFEVPLSGLWEACRNFEREGYAIDARVGGLAEGIEVARRWRLW